MSTKTKPLTTKDAPPDDGVVHLTADNKASLCGVPVGRIVGPREFSERPCRCCVQERLK